LNPPSQRSDVAIGLFLRRRSLSLGGTVYCRGRFLILVVTCALHVCALRAHASNPLLGREAEAIAVAVGDFHKNQGKTIDGSIMFGDLRHYTVELKRHGKEVEIIFIPDMPPLKSNEAGTGGGTIYGCEVHYFVSLQTLKIMRFHFSR
jgi:hypothetical protein